MDNTIAVRMENITKTFGPIVANKDVCLDVRKGEILSLLGENWKRQNNAYEYAFRHLFSRQRRHLYRR